jgi:hypothetical protein
LRSEFPMIAAGIECAGPILFRLLKIGSSQRDSTLDCGCSLPTRFSTKSHYQPHSVPRSLPPWLAWSISGPAWAHLCLGGVTYWEQTAD